MRLWVPGEDELKTENRLDKLVTSFNSFALPSNAMSVSLFIWSTEYSKEKPINNAVLMEIYIALIFIRTSLFGLKMSGRILADNLPLNQRVDSVVWRAEVNSPCGQLVNVLYYTVIY